MSIYERTAKAYHNELQLLAASDITTAAFTARYDEIQEILANLAKVLGVEDHAPMKKLKENKYGV